MAHTVTFQPSFQGFLLSEAEVRDFIDMFYRWGDAKFNILCDESEKRFRGEHRLGLSGMHIITLVRKNITRDYEAKIRIGGNLQAPTLKVGAGMVLAHELQHANQTKIHKLSESFFKSKSYHHRACERDARAFVDEHMEEICGYFAVPFQSRSRCAGAGNQGEAAEEALAVAALLSECEGVTMDDIREELRASGILNPRNVQAVVGELRRQGLYT